MEDMSSASTTLEDHLKKWFGYNCFRAYQKEVVQNALHRRDVLAILPTGAGKSLCYQLPAILSEGTAVVVSPLISLMQDQVSALVKGNISAAYVNSSLPFSELREILSNLSKYKLLYIAPERLNDHAFMGLLRGMPLSFFIIDEAHCISQWGHSFRPDYRQLSLIKKNFPSIPMMAFTATATVEVEKDIISQLEMNVPFIAKGSFDRPNLMIRVNLKSDPASQIDAFLEKHSGQSGIIYAATRKTVDSMYESLRRRGFNLGKYHAGMSDKERQEALHNFIHDKTTLMVATVAFGMGINKPDIRFILHHDMPQTIEQYYQEIGRAGRDGQPAECLMLFSGKDLMTYRSFLKNMQDPMLKEQAEVKMNAIYALCRSPKCRRKGLLNYFGESPVSNECSGCDNCVDGEEKIDGTVIAQKILSCVCRLKERFGVQHVIDVLRGSKNNQVLRNGHETLSTYNLMSECSEGELRYYIDALLISGLLQTSEGAYPVLQWTESSRSVVNGEKVVEFRKRISKDKAKSPTNLPYNDLLFQALRQLRVEIARLEEIPPFAVFTDRALYEMATYFPLNETDLLTINGVGRFKLQSYGARFLKAISEFCLQHNISPPPKKISATSSKAPAAVSSMVSALESFKLLQQGFSVEVIANTRSLTKGTILSHICQVVESQGPTCPIDINELVDPSKQRPILQAIEAVGMEKLSPIKQHLPDEFSYDDIRLVVAFKRASLIKDS